MPGPAPPVVEGAPAGRAGAPSITTGYRLPDAVMPVQAGGRDPASALWAAGCGPDADLKRGQQRLRLVRRPVTVGEVEVAAEAEAVDPRRRGQAVRRVDR